MKQIKNELLIILMGRKFICRGGSPPIFRGGQGWPAPENGFVGADGGWPAPANVFFGAVSLPDPEIGIFSSENKQRARYPPQKMHFYLPQQMLFVVVCNISVIAMKRINLLMHADVHRISSCYQSTASERYAFVAVKHSITIWFRHTKDEHILHT